MNTYIALAVGILIGFIFSKVVLKPKHAGTLLVYETEPDENPDLLLELDGPVETVSKKNYVSFKVKHIRA